MKKVILMLVVALLGTGCSPSTKDKAWSEEVDLGDGKTIVINRTVKFKTSNSWSGDAFGMREIESTLSFTDQAHAEPSWKSNLMPQVLYRDSTNQQWILVASTFNCDIWSEQGKPRPPYWEFRLVNGSWRTESLSPMSFSRRTNLFFRYDQEVPPSPIKTDVKNDILEHLMVTEDYKQIVSDAKPGC